MLYSHLQQSASCDCGNLHLAFVSNFAHESLTFAQISQLFSSTDLSEVTLDAKMVPGYIVDGPHCRGPDSRLQITSPEGTELLVCGMCHRALAMNNEGITWIRQPAASYNFAGGGFDMPPLTPIPFYPPLPPLPPAHAAAAAAAAAAAPAPADPPSEPLVECSICGQSFTVTDLISHVPTCASNCLSTDNEDEDEEDDELLQSCQHPPPLEVFIGPTLAEVASAEVGSRADFRLRAATNALTAQRPVAAFLVAVGVPGSCEDGRIAVLRPGSHFVPSAVPSPSVPPFSALLAALPSSWACLGHLPIVDCYMSARVLLVFVSVAFPFDATWVSPKTLVRAAQPLGPGIAGNVAYHSLCNILAG